MANALLASAALTVLALLGAAAFNPDRGFLLASEPLWRGFGLAAYVGSVLGPLLALATLVRFGVRLGTRWMRRIGQP